MPPEISALAAKYVSSGFSVIPVLADGTKRPAIPWADYQSRRADANQIETWFGNGTARGIGIVHGAISGNSETLDFDHPDAYGEFAELCADHEMSAILESCVHVNTPTGGMHVLYRCEEPITGNQKLAQVSLEVEPEGRSAVLMRHEGYRLIGESWFLVTTKIETRGEGGYTIAPGSPTSVHPSGYPYVYDRAYGKFTDLPVLTAEQRRGLLAMARACNEFVEPEMYAKRPVKTKERNGNSDHLRPGEDFSERGQVLPMLEEAGWRILRERFDGAIELRRPGKNKGVSATYGAVAPNVFYCFTSSASPFENDRAYDPFAVYTFLKCGGDFENAARDLGKAGYGDQISPSIRRAVSKMAEMAEAAEPEYDVEPEPSTTPEETSLPPAYTPTDYGNGLRLVDTHGADIRYCYGERCWYVWDAIRWQQDEGDLIDNKAKDLSRSVLSQAVMLTDPSLQKETAKQALGMMARSKMNAMIDMAKSEVPVRILQLDLDRYLFNCRNGTINLKTGKLEKHKREDLITKLCDVSFDPSAKCPIWERFLAQVIPDRDTREFVHRSVGYGMTGDVTEQCMFFLYGSGSNGKSTFLSTISDVLGEYSSVAGPDLLISKEGTAGAANTDEADLRGARFVTTVEVEDGRKMAEGVMKRITGGDKISARKMRENYTQFDPTHKIFLAANHRPVIKGQDHAIWRRIKVVPFTVSIMEEDKDPELLNKLRAEKAGILAWAVRGCLEWQSKRLGEPAEIAEATRDYREDMDAIKDFLDDCCVLKHDLMATSGAISRVYRGWCEENGIRPIGPKMLTSRLKERKDVYYCAMLPQLKQRGFKGIGFNKAHDPMNDGMFHEDPEPEN